MRQGGQGRAGEQGSPSPQPSLYPPRLLPGHTLAHSLTHPHTQPTHPPTQPKNKLKHTQNKKSTLTRSASIVSNSPVPSARWSPPPSCGTSCVFSSRTARARPCSSPSTSTGLRRKSRLSVLALHGASGAVSVCVRARMCAVCVLGGGEAAQGVQAEVLGAAKGKGGVEVGVGDVGWVRAGKSRLRGLACTGMQRGRRRGGGGWRQAS